MRRNKHLKLNKKGARLQSVNNPSLIRTEKIFELFGIRPTDKKKVGDTVIGIGELTRFIK